MKCFMILVAMFALQCGCVTSFTGHKGRRGQHDDDRRTRIKYDDHEQIKVTKHQIHGKKHHEHLSKIRKHDNISSVGRAPIDSNDLVLFISGLFESTTEYFAQIGVDFIIDVLLAVVDISASAISATDERISFKVYSLIETLIVLFEIVEDFVELAIEIVEEALEAVASAVAVLVDTIAFEAAVELFYSNLM